MIRIYKLIVTMNGERKSTLINFGLAPSPYKLNMNQFGLKPTILTIYQSLDQVINCMHFNKS